MTLAQVLTLKCAKVQTSELVDGFLGYLFRALQIGFVSDIYMQDFAIVCEISSAKL
jgi:predicted thioredoxin/glutaredoxin